MMLAQHRLPILGALGETIFVNHIASGFAMKSINTSLACAREGAYERIANCAVAPRRHDELLVQELEDVIFAPLSIL